MGVVVGDVVVSVVGVGVVEEESGVVVVVSVAGVVVSVVGGVAVGPELVEGLVVSVVTGGVAVTGAATCPCAAMFRSVCN